MLSTFATKLLAWFRIYKVQPTVYNERITNRHAQRRGAFASALSELVAYESTYGYITL